MGITVSTSSSISVVSGYCVLSEAQVGSNGDPNGDPEYDVGSAATQVSGRIEWCDDLSEGFYSDMVEVLLDATAGGGSGVQWSLIGGDPETVTYTAGSYGAISKVEIRAGVKFADMAMAWTSLSLRFYKAGSWTETFTLTRTQNPNVDTTGASDPVAAEMITTVTPVHTDNDEVKVTGLIELSSNIPDELPDPDAIFGQIFVFTSTCSAP